MKKIGLLSDTHGYLDQKILDNLKSVDEIWHVGDFGPGVAEVLEKIKPVKGVFGNIDDASIRKTYPRELRFMCEDVKVMMVHIGGYPPKYEPHIRESIKEFQPDLFLSGHSHILKVMRDKTLNNLLHINPGAAGKHGLHKVRTMIRLTINGKQISDLEVIEMGLRGTLEA
ncbi:MAG: metallophosphoesterase family protein [Bacteroidia bacterium]